jgi:hypothetical protein
VHPGGLVIGSQELLRLGAKALIAIWIAEKILDPLVGMRAATRGHRVYGHTADGIFDFPLRQE